MTTPTGQRVRVRVPASAANLGPGYDSFGLALGRYDEVIAERIPTGLEITVEGVGAGTVPTGPDHLVYQAAMRAFAQMERPVPGLKMHCVNRIPHGGGQGSSAAAIVAGILLARGVTEGGDTLLSDGDVFALATEMEGHPDNVAPALYGGFTVAWMTLPARGLSGTGSGERQPRVLRLRPQADLHAVVFDAALACSTATARAALPAMIPHADAAANSARTALMVHAMTVSPDLLLPATEDFLHQRYREQVMPQTADLIHRLRAAGFAAVLSGAGPSVLVVGTDLGGLVNFEAPGFTPMEMAVPSNGAEILPA